VTCFAVRLMPQLLNYQRIFGELPFRITLVLAALAHTSPGTTRACEYLARTDLWGQDLNSVQGLDEQLDTALKVLAQNGVRQAMQLTTDCAKQSAKKRMLLVHN
jgi:hypothetical protein